MKEGLYLPSAGAPAVSSSAWWSAVLWSVCVRETEKACVCRSVFLQSLSPGLLGSSRSELRFPSRGSRGAFHPFHQAGMRLSEPKNVNTMKKGRRKGADGRQTKLKRRSRFPSLALAFRVEQCGVRGKKGEKPL